MMNKQDPVLGLYKRSAFTMDHGQGMYVWDTSGKKYMDFASGIAVMALGHSHPAVVKAIQEQASRLAHVSNLYPTLPMQRLAEALVENSFADRVFFCNSGTEANEAAIKFTRKVMLKRGMLEQKKIISFVNGFHGRTLGALSVTEKAKFREPFAPLIPQVEFLEFNSIADLEKAVDANTAAVFIEPIQGEGGIIPATPEFLKAARTICDRIGALLVFDEVQSGLGRTGRLWAHEHSSVTPDIMTLAKPLGGGLPCGAVLVTEAVAQAMEAGDHGSTFGANPIATAAGHAVLKEILAVGFLARVQTMGEILIARLRDLQARYPVEILDVRGQGLMIGVEFSMTVAPLLTRLAENGILAITSGEKVMRLLPPLIVEESHIQEFISALDRAISETASVSSTSVIQ